MNQESIEDNYPHISRFNFSVNVKNCKNAVCGMIFIVGAKSILDTIRSFWKSKMILRPFDSDLKKNDLSGL